MIIQSQINSKNKQNLMTFSWHWSQNNHR